MSPKQHAEIMRNFLTCLKLPILENIILGFVPIQWSANDFAVSKIRRYLNILAIILFLPFTAHATYQLVILDYPLIYKTTDALIVLTNSVYIVTLLVSGYLNCEKCIEMIKKIIEFDSILKEYGTNTSTYYCKRKRYVLYEFILSKIGIMLFILCVLIVGDIITENYSFSEITRFMALTSQAAISQLISEIVHLLRFRYIILNKRLRKIVHISMRNNIKTIDGTDYKNERDQFKSLCRVCDLHHRLFKIIAMFNETFGFVLLMMFAASFTIIVIYFFYIAAHLQASEIEWKRLLTCMFFCVPIVYYVVSICNVCYSTIEEAHRSGELIHKIETDDSDMIDEIEMFSLQIANDQVQFNAAGFFPIDRTLLFSIIGGVTTYIIILIQLSSTLID